MPPRSYIITAIALTGLVAFGLYLTSMFAIFLFYWLFGAAACALAAIGVFRISYGLEQKPWIALALVAPCIVWAAVNVAIYLTTGPSIQMALMVNSLAQPLALTAAAAASVRVIEVVSGSSLLIRVMYGILALSAVFLIFNIGLYATGSGWNRNALFAEFAKWVRWPILVAKYGALIVAPVVLVVRRKIELWTLIPIVGIAVVETYAAAFPYQSLLNHVHPGLSGLWFWLKPVVFFIAAAAIWRIGSVLLSQRKEGYPERVLGISSPTPDGRGVTA